MHVTENGQKISAVDRDSSLEEKKESSQIEIGSILRTHDGMQVVDLSPETVKAVFSGVKNRPEVRREETRSQLATFLMVFFGLSLGLACFLVAVAAFNPQTDKEFIKSTISLIITPQVTLLAGALGFYFGSTSQKS